MYRAVALWAIQLNVATSDMHRLQQLAEAAHIGFVPGSETVLLNGEDVSAHIRTPEVGDAASKISQVAAVRRAMVARQRQIGSENSIVMEGRDIGTVVFPSATVKVFLDAQPQARAGRRARELKAPIEKVSSEIDERDRRDRERAESPLVQAADAVYLDTTRLNVEEVEAAVMKIIRERTTNGKERTH